jgi:uncharacterized protein YprB with RNaseH-like and TPR domain
MYSTNKITPYEQGYYFQCNHIYKKIETPSMLNSKNKMAEELRNRVLHMSPEYMKEVCEQIAEIKRVVKESKKQLTKEERQAVRAYRHSMLERIQAVDEMYKEIETGIHTPRLKFTCDVFAKWDQIAKSVPSTHEFK